MEKTCFMDWVNQSWLILRADWHGFPIVVGLMVCGIALYLIAREIKE